MDIKPIHTEADYGAVLREVSKLVDLDPEVGTPDGDRLEVLSTLVKSYESGAHQVYFGVDRYVPTELDITKHASRRQLRQPC